MEEEEEGEEEKDEQGSLNDLDFQDGIEKTQYYGKDGNPLHGHHHDQWKKKEQQQQSMSNDPRLQQGMKYPPRCSTPFPRDNFSDFIVQDHQQLS